MTLPSRFARVTVYLTLSLWLLAACSTAPVDPEPSTEAEHAEPDTKPGPDLDSLAELSPDTDRPIAELADELPDDLKRSELIRLNRAPDSAEGYTIELAKIFYLRNDPKQSTRLLSMLTYDDLEPTLQRDYALLSAKAELALFNPRGTLDWLSQRHAPLFDALPLPQQIEVILLRAQAYSLTNNPIASARERIFIHPLISSAEAQESNIEAIWQELQRAEPEALAVLRLASSAPHHTGWVDLATLYHEHLDDLPRLTRQLAHWQAENPAHPAARYLPVSLTQLTEGYTAQPEHIALILPQSGSLSDPGQAVMDGFLAGYFNAKNQGQDVPKLSFYDENSNNIRSVISEALENGADFIIGPLTRDQVYRLEAEDGLPVTALALNRTDRRVLSNPQVIQFGLAPEDEARQVARLTWQSGHRVAAQIIPNGDWGNRVSGAFNDEWQMLGGELVARETIPASDDGRQYLAQVRALLDIDQSQQRAININAVLGQAVESEPRRRRDIDFIFMPVNPDQGRQLRPLLNFQFAQDVPVFSISSLVSTSDNGRNRDLSGIQLVETPWLLRDFPEQSELRSLNPDRYQENARLYAMGLDTFNLLPRLGQLQNDPNATYAGRTGILSISEHGQIQRELTWAQFVNGQLVPVATDEAMPHEGREPLLWQTPIPEQLDTEEDGPTP